MSSRAAHAAHRWWPLAVAALAVALTRPAARRAAPDPVDSALQAPAVPAWFVRLVALGFESAAADISYLDAIQLFGERLPADTPESERVRRSSAIARLLERTTDLDPSFAYAYVFAAVAVPVATERGGQLNLAAAESLLRKGVAAVPLDWRIPFHLAYLKAVQEGDFTEAARDMAEASRRPNAPKYLPLLVTRLAAQGGAIETGIEVARARLELAESPEERQEIEGRLALLVMERDLRALEAAVDRFRAASGALPASLETLVAKGLLPGIPEEPHGGRYELLPDGTVRSTAAARLRLQKHALDEIRSITAPAGGETPTPAPPATDATAPDAGTLETPR